jgi:DNA-binding MarR family transcriptional regulator
MPARDGNEELPLSREVDRVIHEPARFAIMANLFVIESADFLFLMRRTGMTKGNLSSHMRKLEEAGYIEVVKEFMMRKSHTMLKLTKKGRTAFREYSRNMKQMFDGLPA